MARRRRLPEPRQTSRPPPAAPAERTSAAVGAQPLLQDVGHGGTRDLERRRLGQAAKAVAGCGRGRGREGVGRRRTREANNPSRSTAALRRRSRPRSMRRDCWVRAEQCGAAGSSRGRLQAVSQLCRRASLAGVARALCAACLRPHELPGQGRARDAPGALVPRREGEGGSGGATALVTTAAARWSSAAPFVAEGACQRRQLSDIQAAVRPVRVSSPHRRARCPC